MPRDDRIVPDWNRDQADERQTDSVNSSYFWNCSTPDLPLIRLILVHP
jgi:hypothetical protein